MTDQPAAPAETPTATITPAATPNPSPATTPQATPSPSSPADSNSPAPTDAPKADDNVDSLLLNDKKPEDKKDGEPDKKDEGDKKDGEDKKDDLPPVTVADLTLPADMTVPEDIKGEFEAFVKDAKLDKEGAQKAADLHVKMINKMQQSWNDLKKDWKSQTEKDPDIGGDKLNSTIESVDNLVRKFCKTEDQLLGVQEMLITNGAGVNPHFVKMMATIAQQFKEDATPPTGHISAPESDMARRMWPNMPGDKK